MEGSGTHGWQIGHTWLTLLKGTAGNPQNVEVTIVVQTPQEVDRLREAFIGAGVEADLPGDGLMYVPVRLCSVTDPFGTQILIVCPLSDQTE